MPDGATIVYAGQEPLPPQGGRVPGLAGPLRHGGPWDIRAIAAGGGAPRVLAAVLEDNPYPRPAPDGQRISYISPTGLWSLPAGGGFPTRIDDNAAHSELSIFAPAPRPAPAGVPPGPGTSRCFPETGQCLRGLFLRYWDTHGGLAQFGYPITAELIRGGAHRAVYAARPAGVASRKRGRRVRGAAGPVGR